MAKYFKLIKHLKYLDIVYIPVTNDDWFNELNI